MRYSRARASSQGHFRPSQACGRLFGVTVPLLLSFAAVYVMTWVFRKEVATQLLGRLDPISMNDPCLSPTHWPQHWFVPVTAAVTSLACWPVIATATVHWLSPRSRWYTAFVLGALGSLAEFYFIQRGVPFLVSAVWRPCEELRAIVFWWLMTSLQLPLVVPPIIQAIAFVALGIGAWRDAASRLIYAAAFLIGPHALCFLIMNRLDLILTLVLCGVYAIVDRLGRWRSQPLDSRAM
jgi:hypothetical protein